MNYTLFLHNDESSFADVPDEQMGEIQAAYQAYGESLQEAGIFVAADWLKPSFTATTITLKDGKRDVQDGPFADTKDQLGGYYVINVPDIETAVEWAAKCPAAQYGTVEIRATMFEEE